MPSEPRESPEDLAETRRFLSQASARTNAKKEKEKPKEKAKGVPAPARVALPTFDMATGGAFDGLNADLASNSDQATPSSVPAQGMAPPAQAQAPAPPGAAQQAQPAPNPTLLKTLGVLVSGHEAANSHTARGLPDKPWQAETAGDDEVQAAADAYQAGTDATGSQQAVDKAIAGPQAATAKAAMTADEEAQKKYLADQAQIQKDIETAKNQYMATVDDLKNTRIHSWWSTAGVGASILGIISQTLAGGLQGLAGTTGETPLDRIINRDMEEQRLELEKKKSVVSASQNLYGQLLDQLKDRTLTEQAFRQIAIHSTAERLKNQALVFGGDLQVKANADKATAALTQKYVENLNKANENIARGGGHGSQKFGVGAAGIEHFAEYYKNNPEAAEKLISKISYARAAKTAMDQVIPLIGATVKGPDGRRVFVAKSPKALDALSKDQKLEISQNMAHAVLNIAKYADFGALSEGDKALADSVSGAEGNWMAYVSGKLGISSYSAMYKRIETFKRNVDNDLKARVGVLEVPVGPEGRLQKLKYDPDWETGTDEASRIAKEAAKKGGR